jgi:dihydrofolate reductase
MISIVAAIAKNGVIGSNNWLPWDIPEDLKHFRELTTGKTVLMGRKTFESIISKLGHPMPNRKNLVVTRQADYPVPNKVEVYSTVEDALKAHGSEDVCVIGGGEIFSQTLDKTDVMYLTHIDKEYPGDAYFPEVDWSKWQLTEEEKHEGFTFATYKRKN